MQLPTGSLRRKSGAAGCEGCDGNTEADPAALVCSKWLSRHYDQEQLTHRWQELETRLFRDYNWGKLTEAERRSLPEAGQLEALNLAIEEIHDCNAEQLHALEGIKATTVHGVYCKLCVALAMVPPDENERAHALLRSILKDFETLLL